MPALYVDESIHDAHGFILGAYVFAPDDVNPAITDALNNAGMRPGRDEFKSNLPMQGNAQYRKLRDDLFEVLRHCDIGMLVMPSVNRPRLGVEALYGLASLRARNEPLRQPMDVYFDQGMPPGGAEMEREVARHPTLAGYRFHFEQNSAAILGLQVADLAASTCAQILAQRLLPEPKVILLGEAWGYAPDDHGELGWAPTMICRYGFMAGDRPPEPEPGDPILLNYDPVPPVPINDVYASAIYSAPGLDPHLDAHLYDAFQVWYGCIH